MRKRWIAMMMSALMTFSSVSAFAASSEGLTSIQLNTNYLSLVVGNVYNFDVTQQPLSVKAQPFTFVSSNTNVIRMSGSTAYAVGVGRASVTVKTGDGSLVDTCVIDVQANSSTSTPNYNYPGYYPYSGYNAGYPYGAYNPNYPYGGYYGSSGSANSASDLPETQVFPNTYVAPGKAKDATELGIEFRQSALVSAGSSVVPFIFTRSEKSIIVTPQVVDYSKSMSLSFRGNILNRLPKFDYKNVEFRVGDRIHVYLTADMNSPVQNVVSVENVNVSSLMATDWAQYGNQSITGPWRIMSNVDKPFMQFRFYLGDGFDLKKNEISLLKWNTEENVFEKVDQSTWKLKIYRRTDVSGKYIETDATFSPGTYAVVSTKDIVL